MAFIQVVPPPMPPPPPPGLPIDTGLFFLMVVGLIYGILVLKNTKKKAFINRKVNR